ncbi:tudor domain-containing protein 7A isoform X2 [Cyclopterus lumpus]|uniref:tudor domain-containing protein 7A isoform X2 n=1 Tax=Cyclopterus lumpus TaxID=8103 RepID=UPI001486B3D2|nr:tudor domain-containing protein 7A isoform X2 [Cyclopterus lumpus]
MFSVSSKRDCLALNQHNLYQAGFDPWLLLFVYIFIHYILFYLSFYFPANLRMSDSESIKKMLRSVLQSSKAGVSMSALQSEYRSLCGESIPLRELGHSKLEDYLRSISSVVRLEYHMGEIKCFAAVCKETAHIAELVAKQKSSKKSGRSHVVNCKMRFKPSNPYMLNVRSRSSLRQPSAIGAHNWKANRSMSHDGSRGFSASGDYRQSDQRLSFITPVEHRQPAPQPAVKQCFMPDRSEKNLANCRRPRESVTEKPPERVSRLDKSQSRLYDVELVQSRITLLLKKYCSGFWMSKLSVVYSEMFNEKLHPQVLTDLEKWTHITMVEKPPSTNRADRLIYPPLPPKPSIVPQRSTTNMPPTSPTDSKTMTTPISSHPSTHDQPSTPSLPFPVPKPRVSPQAHLAKPTFLFPPQPVAASSSKPINSVTLRSPARNPALAPHRPSCVNLALNSSGQFKQNPNMPTTALNHNQNTLANWTCPASTNIPSLASSLQPGSGILPFFKVTFSPTSDSVPCPPSTSSAVVVSAEVCQRIKELLTTYTQGLWAHALPKLFMDTYKTPFPKNVLENLSLLPDIFTVEYPIPHDKKKAILYNSKSADMKDTQHHVDQPCRSHPLPSGLEVLGPVVPPCLVLPSEQYPSVLITNAKRSNAVTLRYVGENYSNAQEVMEGAMHSFYSQSATHLPLSKPVVGQLVAVRGEDGEELARAQVMDVMAPNKVKVYYVDYGFSVETSETNLLELHQDFLSLPFQAISVGLAGLEAFSSYPPVLSSLDKLAVGKILLMETLESCQQNETPVAVLYDTSQDDDININSTCLKALQDVTMSNPLTINATYQDVCVTNVCADGIIYCQLPCRGTAKLGKLLEETGSFFISQMTSELLVSRPFSGKFCLARYKGMWSRVEIANIYGNRVIEILFIDLGVQATVEVTDLREIPPLFLKDFTVIPPLAIKCRLADVTVPEGDWSPEAVLWLKKAVLGSEDCKMKILKLDQHKEGRLVYMYLFIGADSQEMDKSINHQLAQSELWQKFTTQNNNKLTCNNGSGDIGLSALIETLTLGTPVPNTITKSSTGPLQGAEVSTPDMTTKPLVLPPPLELPQPGQNMDVFVPVACHPGYFVVQPWQDLHKLVVLMGEMMLYYNQTWNTPNIQNGQIYAAKIDKNWHRVQVKGILANGLVSVFELDYGKHELLQITLFRPLIEEFRQLPFQAITTQLAGMTQPQWSEEASMLFRNHVENRALVAQVYSVSEVTSQLWQSRLTVYLVDTTYEEKDLWIHSLMADISGELSSAA